MRRATTIAEVRAAVAAERAAGRRVGLAPTMGALHEGHLANIRLAAEVAGLVVVSIFVNPTQFDRPDDLAAYPRDLDSDEAALAALGGSAPELVFAPAVDEMYPHELLTTVQVRGVADQLEGAARPGHFDGVATVVTKLLNIVAPDVAVFGRKDAQQNQVIRQLVADLDLPVEIVVGPTVREPDGLALSSRNRRLDPDQRQAALVLSRALRAGVEVARRARAGGATATPAQLRRAATATLAGTRGVDVDYVEVVDPDTFTPADDPDTFTPADDRTAGPERAPEVHHVIVVAAFVGDVRLIDNVEVGDRDDEQRVLDATDGTHP